MVGDISYRGVGRGCGVGRCRALGGGVGQGIVMTTVSMRHPSLEMLLSLPILQRRIIGSDEYGRFTFVLINPPEFPVHA
jgi:hypothetical protein